MALISKESGYCVRLHIGDITAWYCLALNQTTPCNSTPFTYIGLQKITYMACRKHYSGQWDFVLHNHILMSATFNKDSTPMSTTSIKWGATHLKCLFCHAHREYVQLMQTTQSKGDRGILHFINFLIINHYNYRK